MPNLPAGSSSRRITRMPSLGGVIVSLPPEGVASGHLRTEAVEPHGQSPVLEACPGSVSAR